VIREATVDTQDGVSVGGHMTNVIRYADDKAVVSTDQPELHRLINKAFTDKRKLFLNTLHLWKRITKCFQLKGQSNKYINS